jgi:hypothetical protein
VTGQAGHGTHQEDRGKLPDLTESKIDADQNAEQELRFPIKIDLNQNATFLL